MFSQTNSVLVFTSDYTGPSLQPTIDLLEEGGVGWYDKNGAIGTGGKNAFLCMRRGGVVYKSVESLYEAIVADAFAPATAKSAQSEIIAGTEGYHELAVTFDIPGMTGKYIKKGVYRAKASDSGSDIADALVASFNAGMSRESNALAIAAVSGGGNDQITVTALKQPYVEGRFKGEFSSFSAALYGPDVYYNMVVSSAPGTPGVGEGWWVYEKESFAWGNQDSFRENALRASFPTKHYAKVDGEYNLAALQLQGTSSPSIGEVKIKQTVYCAFDSNGTAPPAAP